MLTPLFCNSVLIPSRFVVSKQNCDCPNLEVWAGGTSLTTCPLLAFPSFMSLTLYPLSSKKTKDVLNSG